MTQSIDAFLNERKELWLKERLKKAQNETEVSELNQQATEKFSLQQWLPDAAKRVAQLSMVSHPSKFSHPSAKTSTVIASALSAEDGYLRSGNIAYSLDVFGNAAAMDVYKFLCIKLSNAKSILENFEHDAEILINCLKFSKLDYEKYKKDFLQIKAVDNSSRTDHLVKQVYFPIQEQDYHLLSILTASGLITELKKRIDNLRFSEVSKLAKENRKKNLFDENGYSDIFELTVTAYGGTQPQNVSVLNSQNAGRAYLLASLPPKIERRTIRLPKNDFFKQCLYRKNFQSSFSELHKLIQLDINNDKIRTGIKNIIKYVIDAVLFEAFKIRHSYANVTWSSGEYYADLPHIQKIWLDEQYLTYRENNSEWRDEICVEISRWIIKSYESLIIKSHQLGDAELAALTEWGLEELNKNKEYF